MYLTYLYRRLFLGQPYLRQYYHHHHHHYHHHHRVYLMQYLNQLCCSRTTLLSYSLHYSTSSVIMASESCTSIIDWLSDIEVEVSAHWEQPSRRAPSFPNATFSPTIHAPSYPSSPSLPCLVGLQHSRKRKHHKDWLDSCPKDPYFPREPLNEMMSSPNKRARTNSEPLEDEREAQAEVRSIDHDTASK